MSCAGGGVDLCLRFQVLAACFEDRRTQRSEAGPDGTLAASLPPRCPHDATGCCRDPRDPPPGPEGRAPPGAARLPSRAPWRGTVCPGHVPSPPWVGGLLTAPGLGPRPISGGRLWENWPWEGLSPGWEPGEAGVPAACRPPDPIHRDRDVLLVGVYSAGRR